MPSLWQAGLERLRLPASGAVVRALLEDADIGKRERTKRDEMQIS